MYLRRLDVVRVVTIKRTVSVTTSLVIDGSMEKEGGGFLATTEPEDVEVGLQDEESSEGILGSVAVGIPGKLVAVGGANSDPRARAACRIKGFPSIGSARYDLPFAVVFPNPSLRVAAVPSRWQLHMGQACNCSSTRCGCVLRLGRAKRGLDCRKSCAGPTSEVIHGSDTDGDNQAHHNRVFNCSWSLFPLEKVNNGCDNSLHQQNLQAWTIQRTLHENAKSQGLRNGESSNVEEQKGGDSMFTVISVAEYFGE